MRRFTDFPSCRWGDFVHEFPAITKPPQRHLQPAWTGFVDKAENNVAGYAWILKEREEHTPSPVLAQAQTTFGRNCLGKSKEVGEYGNWTSLHKSIPSLFSFLLSWKEQRGW